MWWFFAGGLVATIAFVIVDKRHAGRDEDDTSRRRKKREFHKSMSEGEYVQLIPQEELRRVRKLISQIVEGRGGWAATDLVQLDSAWQRVVEGVRAPEGGGWSDSFGAEELQEDRLQRLSCVIDDVLLGGVLRKELRRRRRRDEGGEGGGRGGLLGFSVDEDDQGEADWISYFDEGNVVHLLRRKWSQDVHALVLNLFPDIDKASEAYLPDQRHGPIFKLMNKRLFGHSSDSYRHVFST